MRAPPVAVKLTKGSFCSTAASTPRVKRSPTTLPMLPPMNSNSKQAATTGTLITAPPSTTRASVSPVSSSAAFRRCGYFLLSLNFSASTGSTSWPISQRPSGSRKASSRWRAPMRWWWSHLGQTLRLPSRSVL